MAPPGNQTVNGENKRQPAVSGETSLLDSISSMQFIFIAFVVIDLVIRMPLLISIPETLGSYLKSEAPAAPDK